jgi:hypothetical protein
MKCAEATEFVSALCDGETIPRPAAEHIGECEVCRARLKDYAEIGAELRRVASLEPMEEARVRSWEKSERAGSSWWTPERDIPVLLRCHPEQRRKPPPPEIGLQPSAKPPPAFRGGGVRDENCVFIIKSVIERKSRHRLARNLRGGRSDRQFMIGRSGFTGFGYNRAISRAHETRGEPWHPTLAKSLDSCTNGGRATSMWSPGSSNCCCRICAGLLVVAFGESVQGTPFSLLRL